MDPGEILTDNEFVYDDGYYINGKYGISLTIADDTIVSLSIDGIDDYHALDWLNLNDDEISSRLLELLFDWVKAHRKCVAPGFIDGVDGIDIPLPDIELDSHRKLKIYTRGDFIMKSKPKHSQASFNALILTCHGDGVNLRKNNGLTKVVQDKLKNTVKFPEWIKRLIHKVETDNLHEIDIFCKRGRHRSVAAAEILRKYYYPNAEVYHLTIK